MTIEKMPTVSPKYVWPVFFLILFTGWAGFLLGKLTLPSQTKTTTVAKNQNLFTNPTANTRGKITSINGKKVTFTNSNQVSAEFELLTNVNLNNPENGTSKVISSTDKSSIPLNKDVNLDLILVNGVYKINTISLLASPPPIPKTSPTITK